MRVALQPARPPAPIGFSAPPRPLLDPAGPGVVLGAEFRPLPAPVVPARTTLFGPRGAALLGEDGPLWVADTGHHRLLGWARRPARDSEGDNAPADWVIGQPDFSTEGRNGKIAPHAASLNVPTGMTRYGRGLAVADAWNHRVLIWNKLPEASRQPADLVLGQAYFTSVLANRGRTLAGAATLNWCYGIFSHGERLYVADTGNRRVLIWDRPPVENGQPADAVLGQADFACRDENGGSGATLASMRWPHQLALVEDRLAVADAGNNRVMLWQRARPETGAPADLLLGQASPGMVEHNRGRYLPDAASLNMPYGIAAAGGTLLVADTANSRLLGWDTLASGAAASRLSGQPDFAAKGDNRWQPVARDSLCWPYGLAVAGSTAVIADSGNNRVLLWELAA
jgi:hypothetical protein